MPQYQNPGLPSNLYAGAAVRVDTRPLANMLYNEQKMRQAQAQKEAAALDEEKQANVAKIRDADVPDFVNQYQQYSQAKKRLMNDTRLRKDPQAYAAAQMEVAKLYGGAMKLANESRQARDLYEHVDKDRFTHPENYVEDYFDKRSIINKAPLSKLRQVQTGIDPTTGQPTYTDYSSPDVLLYKGADYDPTKLFSAAQGTELKREIDEGATDKTGLQNKITTYQFHGNSPMQYRDTLMTGILGDRKAAKYFEYLLKNTNPADIEAVNKQFDAIPAEIWKLWGVDKQELTSHIPDNKAEAVANFLAKKYAIENIPKALKTDLRTNEAVKTKMGRDWDLYMEGIKQRNRETLKKMKGAGEGGEDDGSYDIVETMWQEAKNNPRRYEPANGAAYVQYEINPTQQQKEMFAYKYVDKDGKQQTIYPDTFRFSKDGRYITPIFYKGERSSTGKIAVDADISKPILVDVLRSAEGKRNFGVKENKAIMSGSQKTATNKKYSLSGKNYTHKELNKLGYSDEEINEALKAGIIK